MTQNIKTKKVFTPIIYGAIEVLVHISLNYSYVNGESFCRLSAPNLAILA